jgi:hypothetical protein
MKVYHENATPTVAFNPRLSALIASRIDALPTMREQCVAAAIEMLLTSFIEIDRHHELTLAPTPLSIPQIAGTAGYPKAAVWHALPIIASAGLISWRKLDADQALITWLLSDGSVVSA